MKAWRAVSAVLRFGSGSRSTASANGCRRAFDPGKLRRRSSQSRLPTRIRTNSRFSTYIGKKSRRWRKESSVTSWIADPALARLAEANSQAPHGCLRDRRQGRREGDGRPDHPLGEREARHSGDPRSVGPGRADHVSRVDLALLREDASDSAVTPAEPLHGAVGVEARPVALSRTGEGEGGLERVSLAVRVGVEPANVRSREARDEPRDRLASQQVGLDAELAA